MKIGILQTGHAPDALIKETGDYDAMFQKLLAGHGFEFQSWSVETMEFPESVHDADGWLMTGSRHGAYEDKPFIAPLEDFLRKAYAESVPIVGICFGHQILAQALGGKVAKFKDGWAVGRQTYRSGDRDFTLNAWHQDQVIEKPAEAEVCATSDFCKYAALIYGDRAFTVQAHPEYSTDFIADLARTRGKGLVPQDLLDALPSDQGQHIDDALLASQIATFFKERKLTS